MSVRLMRFERSSSVLCCRMTSVCFLIVIAAGRLAVAQTADWEGRLRAEGPRGWAALKASYGRLEGAATQVRTFVERGKPPKPPERLSWEFRFNKSRNLLLQQETRQDPQGGIGGARVIVDHPETPFILTRRPAGPWIVAQFGAPAAAMADIALESGVLVFLESPWEILEQPIEELLEDPGFRIKEIVSPDGHLARMTFEYAPPADAGTPLRNGWVLLDPRRSWSIREYNVDMDAGKESGKLAVQVEYDEGSNPPALKSVSYVLRNLSRKATVESTFTVDRQSLRDVPEEEFSPSAFGLPDFEFSTSDSAGWRLEYLLIVLALLAFVIAIAFYRRSRRVRIG